MVAQIVRTYKEVVSKQLLEAHKVMIVGPDHTTVYQQPPTSTTMQWTNQMSQIPLNPSLFKKDMFSVKQGLIIQD